MWICGDANITGSSPAILVTVVDGQRMRGRSNPPRSEWETKRGGVRTILLRGHYFCIETGGKAMLYTVPGNQSIRQHGRVRARLRQYYEQKKTISVINILIDVCLLIRLKCSDVPSALSSIFLLLKRNYFFKFFLV